MKPVRHLRGTLQTLANTRHIDSQTRFVIRKKHSAQPRYYQATLWGYKWVRKSDDATVFFDRRFLQAELLATDMVYYDAYEIIQM